MKFVSPEGDKECRTRSLELPTHFDEVRESAGYPEGDKECRPHVGAPQHLVWREREHFQDFPEEEREGRKQAPVDRSRYDTDDYQPPLGSILGNHTSQGHLRIDERIV